MAKEIIITDEKVHSKIYQIRNQQVMLDSELAEMYGVETKQLKRQVRRNLDRFPEDFMFELTKEEAEILRSQTGTSSWGGARYVPMVFTEQGVAMLSSVLSSPLAIKVNIQIIRVFTKMRALLMDNKNILLKLEKIDKKLINIGHDVRMHDDEIETIFTLIDEIRESKTEIKPRNPIGFKTKSGDK